MNILNKNNVAESAIRAPKTNAALIVEYQNITFITDSLKTVSPDRAVVLVSDQDDLLPPDSTVMRVNRPQIDRFDDVSGAATLAEWVQSVLSSFPDHPVVIDTSLSQEGLDGAASIRLWAEIAAALADTLNSPVISLYDRNALIESHLQPLLCAHPMFLAPSGLYDNPFWVPPHLRQASIDEQMSYFLGHIVPDYAETKFFDEDGRSFARGYEPGWLSTPPELNVMRSRGVRWNIRCLGQLRVYRDGEMLDWNQPGGSANKTRCLFAYLLMAGEKGAHVDQIGEVLWHKGDKSELKRNRLHHCVAMLRKVLRSKDMVIRRGEYYALAITRSTWTDVNAFEQNCRRGLFLAKEGQEANALRIYQSAEKLYEGDLFEDLPVQYTETDIDEWCLPRRRWLRNMRVKLLRDMSVCLRSMGQAADALQMCQKALYVDPLSEDVLLETMRVYQAQTRFDAITRLFREYEEKVGADAVSDVCKRAYKSLMG